MGRDSPRIGIQITKIFKLSIRLSYGSVCHHPFLVGTVCFLIFMYRSFPFLFSLLVSASPVLVCTALLLGTILSFGQPNIPNIEKEDEFSHTHDVASLRTGVSEDNITLVKESESFHVESYSRCSRDVDEAVDEVSRVRTEASEDHADDSPADIGMAIDEISREIQCKKLVIEEVGRKFHDLELERKRDDETFEEEMGNEGEESDQEVVPNQYFVVEEVGEDENLEDGNGKSPRGSADDQVRVEGDSSPDSWRPEKNDDVDDSESESESDRAESMSPDASMADILPMLDELHPLLYMEASERAPMLSHDDYDVVPRDESDIGSEQSHRTTEGCVESDEDSEDKEVQKEADGDEDNDEDEAQGSKEDGSKSAITWTEDDQKNLMDLGTLELERNQRLESLIARRLARKSFKLMDEKNLIDLESFDLPCKVLPISTVRRNPFDSPVDSYEDMGLPPIPGSAPSILLPRRNPFDLPYYPNEEKPDLKTDSFQKEFTILTQQKDNSLFRRHESFSVGPSTLGSSKQEKHDNRWRPYFVPEWLNSEGTSYRSIRRQLSSESKASSIPDTDSESSAEPSLHRQLSDVSSADPSIHRQLSEVGSVNLSTHGQLSDISESKVSSVPDTGSPTSATDPDDKKLSRQNSSQETELIFNMDHVLDNVQHGSQSSDDVDSVDKDVICDEVELTLRGLEDQREIESSSYEAGEEVSHVEVHETDINPKPEPVEHESDRSSTSSFSEVCSMITDLKQEESTGLEPRADDGIEESVISKEPPFEESPFSFPTRMGDDNQHRDPVYDSSPPAIEKFLSFSSISSDHQLAISEMGSPSHPMSVETNLRFTDEESELRSKNMEKDNSDNEEMHSPFSQEHEVDDIDSRMRDAMETTENSFEKESAGSGVDQNVDHRNGYLVPPSVDDHILIVPTFPTSDVGVLEANMAHKEQCHHEQHELHSSSSEEEILVEADLSSSSYLKSYDGLTSSVLEEERSSVVLEHAPAVHPNIHVSETVPIEIHPTAKEETLDFEHDPLHSSSSSENGLVQEALMYAGESSSCEQNQQVHPSSNTEINVGAQSPSSDGNIDVILRQNMDLEVVSTVPLEKSTSSELEKQLSWEDKSVVVDHPSDAHLNLEGPSIINISMDDASPDKVVVPEVCNPEEEVSPDLSLLAPHITTITSESPENLSAGSVDDLNDNVHIETEIEGKGLISGNMDYYEKGYESHIVAETIIGEDDEPEDIDEHFLSELDAVGDFSMMEVVSESPLQVSMITEETDGVGTEKTRVVEAPDSLRTNSELPILEARSVEDIEVAFKQLHEGEDVKDVIVPGSFEGWLDTDVSKDSGEISLSLPVVEARCVEDIQAALKQHSDFDIRELPKQLDSNDESAEVEANEVSSTKDSESNSSRPPVIAIVKDVKANNLESAIQENSTVAIINDDELNNSESGMQESVTVSFDKPSESSGPSICDKKGKKVRSHKSNSSSSSSSSDSN